MGLCPTFGGYIQDSTSPVYPSTLARVVHGRGGTDKDARSQLDQGPGRTVCSSIPSEVKVKAEAYAGNPEAGIESVCIPYMAISAQLVAKGEGDDQE